MFLLSYNSFGDDSFTNVPTILQNYNKLSFNGACELDGIHLLDYKMSVDEIKSQTEEPEYDIGSIIVANFENTLEVGSLTLYVGDFPTKYIIRRKADNEVLNKKIAEVAVDVVNFIDYTPKNKTNYTYTVSPYYDDGDGTIIEGRGLEGVGMVSFSGWVLSDTSSTPVKSYLFDIEIESDEFRVNRGFRIFENHTKFPVARFNNMQYRTGSLTTMPFNEQLEATDIQLQDIMEFIENGEEKILRSPSGDVMKVITSDFSYNYYDKIESQPYKISFNITEIGTV
jgi:hypothetical protein